MNGAGPTHRWFIVVNVSSSSHGQVRQSVVTLQSAEVQAVSVLLRVLLSGVTAERLLNVC